jgi:hypothetical protein
MKHAAYVNFPIGDRQVGVKKNDRIAEIELGCPCRIVDCNQFL